MKDVEIYTLTGMVRELQKNVRFLMAVSFILGLMIVALLLIINLEI